VNRLELSHLGVEPEKVGEINGKPTYKVKIKNLSQTVGIIRSFILEGSQNPNLRLLVSRILKNCKSKNFPCYVEKIVEFVRSNVKYVDDPQRMEVLQSPERTLHLGMGDCDDFTILTGALLRTAGFPVRIVLGDVNGDGKYEHVYLKVMLPNKTWLTVDPTVRNPFQPKDYPEKEIKIAERSSLLSGEIRTRIVKRPLYRMVCSPLKVERITEEREGGSWKVIKRETIGIEKQKNCKPYAPKPLKKEKEMSFLDRLFQKIGNVEIITPKKHYGIFAKDGSLKIVYSKKSQKAPPQPKPSPSGYYEGSSLPSLPSPPPYLLIGGAVLLGTLLLGKRR